MGNEIVEDFETVVNTLSKAWDIIKDNKPKADFAGNSCNAVPDVKDWTDLQEGGYSATRSRTIRMGNSVSSTSFIDVSYSLKYTYGATYKGGGAYIPSCTVDVEQCVVEWMFYVSVKLDVLETNNAGTRLAPVAHLRVKLSEEWGWIGAMQSRSVIYNLYGDGRDPVVE
jgi:hypothetical protein